MRKTKGMTIAAGVIHLINALFLIGVSCYVIYLLFGSISATGMEASDNGLVQLFQGLLAGLVFMVYGILIIVALFFITIAIVSIVAATKPLKAIKKDIEQYDKARSGLIFDIVWFFVIAFLWLTVFSATIDTTSKIIAIISIVTIIIANILLIIDLVKSKKEYYDFKDKQKEAKSISNDLVEQIIELDNELTAGNISKEEYDKKRAELVAKEAKKKSGEDLFKV